MNTINLLSSSDVQQFLTENEDKNIEKILLRKSPFQGLTPQDLAMQLKGRKVAKRKFPHFLQSGVIFPPQLNMEQTSSETTARYKTQLLSGNSFLDLTCGFGIDAYFISDSFREITLVERNFELLEMVQHNWSVLGKKARFVHQNLEDFLENQKEKFDCIYLDPARRDEQKRKVFLLEDLSPNLLEIQKKLFQLGEKIAVKLSPLIDIHYLIEVLEGLQELHIISVKNEVKEVLVILENKPISKEEIIIHCVNLETEEPTVTALWRELQHSTPAFGNVEQYLFIPNNTLLKAQALSLLSEKFGLRKLHPNTQLLTGNDAVPNFPGRVLKVEAIKSNILKKNEKYNIISKNHPLTPEQIKKKYKLGDGGEKYLIFTQSIEGKLILKSE